MTQPASRRPLVLLAALVLAWPLAACNTVKGVGKDITYAGEKTEEAITGKGTTEKK
jgi:predicted small secreted protein